MRSLTSSVGARRLAAILAVASVATCSSSAPVRRPMTMRLAALDGGTVDLASYRGRVVILHCFTTWSAAAQNDLEQLVSAHTAYDRAVVVIGVALDPDGYTLVSPWRKATRTPYLIVVASDLVRAGTSDIGRISAVPTTLVVARDGTLAERITGPLRPGQLDRLVTSLLR